VFARYQDDPRTPQALYNSGLMYEKGDSYEDAIRVYDIVAGKFPESKYARDAAYSIGVAYQDMDEHEKAAEAFTKFAENFDDKAMQVEALVEAGDAYLAMDRLETARESYLGATTLYEKFKNKADYNKSVIAKAYFKLGEIGQRRYNAISLKGRSEKAVQQKVEEKVEALKEVGDKYARAIKTGIREWVMRATYRIGESFVQMAHALENQSLFGNEHEKVAGKIQVLMKLEQYYLKAIEKFQWNLDKAREDNFTSDIVEKSQDMLMKCAYERAKLFERVGNTLANSPIPREFNEEERRIYQEKLQDKKLEAIQQAIPKYEEAVRVAKDYGIANSQWLDSTQTRLDHVAPTSEFIQVDIAKWEPEKDTTQQATAAADSAARADSIAAAQQIVSIDENPVEEEEKKGEGKPWYQFWMFWK
jgi:tetratricopeptide (TPR) repeat protein